MSLEFSPGLVNQLINILLIQNRTTSIQVSCFLDECVYITLDGRILLENDDHPLYETNDPLQIHGTLLVAAARFNLPELRSFIPSCPPNGIVCPTCQGAHFIDGNILCMTCEARGWIEPDTP